MCTIIKYASYCELHPKLQTCAMNIKLMYTWRARDMNATFVFTIKFISYFLHIKYVSQILVGMHYM